VAVLAGLLNVTSWVAPVVLVVRPVLRGQRGQMVNRAASLTQVVLVVPLVKPSIKMATLSHGQVVTIQLM
jgi:hypothetical protein